MQALIDFVLMNLRAIWPLFIVKYSEMALIARRGIPHRVLEPGLHWRIPFLEAVEKVSVVVDGMNLLVQSITTKDGQTVSFSANFMYEVVDVQLRLTKVRDFELSLQHAAMIHLASRVREKTLEEILQEQSKLEDSLRGTLTTRAKKWGVRIVDVGLTDLVPAKQYRLFTEGPLAPM